MQQLAAKMNFMYLRTIVSMAFDLKAFNSMDLKFYHAF